MFTAAGRGSGAKTAGVTLFPQESYSVTFVGSGALRCRNTQSSVNLSIAITAHGGGRYVQFAIELKDDWLKALHFKVRGGRLYQNEPVPLVFPALPLLI
ncbi:hypothetical protein KCP70_05585 [Salmonella enterica subsp. enterica]|nr:hypothetical protein KCP70_05585 [Salmonella enterica subsp. enterica]